MKTWAREEFERYRGEKDERKIRYLLDIGKKDFERATGWGLGRW